MHVQIGTRGVLRLPLVRMGGEFFVYSKCPCGRKTEE